MEGVSEQRMGESVQRTKNMTKRVSRRWEKMSEEEKFDREESK
jgi:hypothetical protein